MVKELWHDELSWGIKRGRQGGGDIFASLDLNLE